MARRRSRRWGILGLWWASGPVKLVALGLVIAVTAGIAGDAVTATPGGSGGGYPRGPGQRWGSAESGEHVASGGPRNRTLPATLRGRYPGITWNQAKNTASVAPPPATTARGFVPATSREIPAGRGANERTYANADGTETTEFSTAPVNYRTAHGWQPIDTRLTPDGDTGWRATAGRVDLRVARTADSSRLGTLSTGSGPEISFGLAGAAGAAGKAEGSEVTYPDVRPHVDLTLEARPDGVKETLVLSSPAAPSSYVFPLRPGGLTAKLTGGEVVFTDQSGARRAVIPAGDMVDATQARSTGVGYRLVTSGGAPALEVTLDSAWLHDPARAFPVLVDPTVQLPVEGAAADSAMYVHDGSDSAAGDHRLLVGTVDGKNSAAYLKFSGLVDRLAHHTIFGAKLWAVNFNSDSCKARQVTVHPVTGAWSGAAGHPYPGPAVGGAVASRSFAHGYIAFGHPSSACPTKGETFDLGVGGRDLVQRWVDGTQPNYGISLRASSDPVSGKEFTGTSTENPPKLFVTHSPYNASYSLPDPVPDPPVLQNQNGKVKVAVTNKSAAAWAPGDYYLAYRAYNANTGKSVTQQRAANLTSTVPRGGRVTFDATIKALPPGKYFLDFTMVKSGGPVFTDHQVPPARIVLQVFDIPPVVQELYPPNGYQAPTLTPQLWARALDIDAPPSSSLQFKFEICERDDAGKPVHCVNSGYQGRTAWTVSAQTLVWSKAYLWRTYVKDANNEVISPFSALLTRVPQPEITARLAGAPYGDQQREFDPQVGNYSTAAVDAGAATAGPQLTLTRTYNSLDPRRDGLFGAGWTSGYDMKLVADDDGSGNVVVTYQDGQEVRFGRNPDGSYAAPAGRNASLTVDASAWRLADRFGTTYQFSLSGRLTRITDAASYALVLTYDTTNGRLARAQVSNSTTNTAGRSLFFTWSGNHVSNVRTDPVNGTALSWNYTYDGDVLTKVCAPEAACTTYDHATGSHYRTAVLDSHPESYWRLGEPDGSAAGSEVDVNLGKDAGEYANVTLGTTATAIAGTPDTAATFNGTTSTVGLPKGTVKKSRDAAVELWFKNSPTGGGGPLLGYQDKALGTASGTGVPVLYVGTDGKLRGQFATGGVTPITSGATVNDGRWHHAVLSAMGTTQTLYLDGAKVGELTGKTIDASLLTFNQIGAAYASTPASWPAWGETARRSFAGAIDEVALYSGPLGAASVATHYKAATTPAGQLTKVTLPSGRVAAAVTYDVNRDRVQEYTDANGGTWKIGAPTVYGGDTDLRRSVEVLDPAGRSSLYEYDAIGGWLLRLGQPLGQETRDEDTPGEPATPPPPPVETCTQPDPDDPAFCTTIPDDSGGPVFVRYDADGVSIRSFGYDENGNLTTVSDENADTTTLTYDARGNVTAQTTCRAADSCQTSRTTYPTTITNPSDPRAYLPTETRDARSAGATDNTYRTSYTYQPTGQLTTRTTPDGGTVRNTYTTGAEAAVGGGTVPAALLASTTDPRDKTTRYGYYQNGDLARVTTPSGLITEYTYDAIGRLVSEKEISDSFPAGVSTTYTYDGMSRPLTVTEPATTDAVQTTVHHQRRTSTSYDQDGNPTRVEVSDLLGDDPARVTTTDYDEHGLPARITDGEGDETSYGYDPFGNLTSQTDPNGNRYDYAYTARNSLSEVRLRDWHSDPPGAPPTGTGDHLVLHAYSYDLAGRLASDTDAMGRRTDFTYYGDGLLHRAVLADFHDPDGSAREYTLEDDTYDAAGNLTRQATGNGRVVTQFTSDVNGRPLSTVVDPGGLDRTTAYTYDKAGNVTRTTRHGKPSNVPWIMPTTPETVDYTYDDAGNLATETSTDGTDVRTTSYGYDRRGLQTSSTDPRGNLAGATKAAFTTTVTYDELGRPVRSTGPAVAVESGGNPAGTANPTRVIGYDTFDDQVAVTDELGNTRRASFDRAGRVTTQTAPAYLPPGAATPITPTVHTGYDGNGNVTEVTDARGNTTRTGYDQLDRTVTVDTPADTNDERAVTTFTYTRTGQVLSTVDPTGARTEATYDDLDRQVTATDLERHPAPGTFTSTFRYDDAGNLVKTTSATGAATTNAFDNAGELITSTDPAGVPTRYGYDFAGRQVRESDGIGRTAQTAYDLFGEVVAESDRKPDGTTLRTTRYVYDAAGNVVSTTDPLQATTTYDYDAAGQLVRQVEPVDDGMSITTTFGYDAAGNSTRLTDGRGNSTITTYNHLGVPESTVEPATAAQPDPADRTWTTGYDANANPNRLVAPGGVVRQRTYDAANRLTAETGTGAESATTPRATGYDLAGRPLRSNDDTYTYDDRGNLLSTAGPSGDAAFAYDGDGRLTTRTDAAGTSRFGYAAGRLTTVTDGLTGTVEQLGYDGAGQPKTVDYGSGRTRTLTYDDFARPATDTLTNGAAQPVAAITYRYDLDDQLTEKTTAGTAGAGGTTYTYDQAGRLTSDTTGGTTTGYRWDAAGNRIQAGATTAGYDERNRLLTAGGTSYGYTPRGTLRTRTGSGGTEQFGYDAFDRLVTAPGQSYTYDGLDRVASRNGTAFSYAGQGDEPVSDGTETFARGPGDEPLAVGAGDEARLTVSDLHGDVVAAFDPADTALTGLAGSTAYGPFGQVTAHTGDTGNLGYQGDWTDPGTGQVDMGARWYDPATGTFDSRDGAAADPATDSNRYRYANSDPVNGADPTGNWCTSALHVKLCTPKASTLWKAGRRASGPEGDLLEFELKWLWNVVKPTPLGDDSCTGMYGMDCDVWFHQYPADSLHNRFCDTHGWTSQCGGSGRYPYSSGGGGGRGGGGGVSTAQRDAEAARRAAYEHAKHISDMARQRAADDAMHNPIAVNPAALAPTIHLPALVSPVASAPAAVVATVGDVVADAKAATDAIYDAALKKAGDVVDNVSDASRVETDTSDNAYRLRTRTRNSEDCRGKVPSPAQNPYRPVDKANGNRATGMEVCLTADNISGGTAAGEVKPPGYRWAQRYAAHLGDTPPKYWINNCHLLASQLGGSGSDLRNLSTCSRAANSTPNDELKRDPGMVQNMYNVETKVKKAVEHGQIVDYEVIPVYKGRRTVPVAYEMSAVGYYESGAPGINLHEPVPNMIYSVKFNRWNNLGTVNKFGRAVPYGGMT